MDEGTRKRVERQLRRELALVAKKYGLAREIRKTCVYGECVDCGEPIPPRRLLAVPGTKRCYDCQQTEERG